LTYPPSIHLNQRNHVATSLSRAFFNRLSHKRAYVISLKGFPLSIQPNWRRTCTRSNISHELRDANFKGGNTMHWSKISAAGLFVIGLTMPALFTAPDVARAQVIVIAPSHGYGYGYARPYGYVRPYGGVRRAARAIGRAHVRRKIRRKIRRRIRRR
jgi:hypothetical protein